MELYESIRDVNKWNPKRREELAAVHGGTDALQSRWSEWLDTMGRIFEDKQGDICTAFLPDVKCKTLVLQGEKDTLVPRFQAEYLSERILHSKLIMLPDATHALPMDGRWKMQVNDIILSFLEEPDDSATHSREFAAMPPRDRKNGSPTITHSGHRC
ncbi:hypothetical protein AC1031_016057 [Aphanomyces cochlioides]|nr:hypothetical protein AC1031_016057 [Aphanomyces cochlioides]